jgi:hypothetical protein
MKTIIIVLVPLLLSACASFEQAPLSAQGGRVRVATAITVSETEQYQSLGALYCTTSPLLDCDVDLRNQAGALGGEVIVIESRAPSACAFSDSHDCLTVYARAYRKRTDG